ncbi:XdhC family protein [Pontibacter anaerobius]|uniref:XdhC family protein n=1 Tax=Pontibacter anaerobius TaxID=2993940 RepID=A0ABT3RH52_9BACT|nr:XdhC/CoxI family protein [Pontibacter anaerobius]MCX2740959.1 XdhC family protein [Pontibacter anaerobius]
MKEIQDIVKAYEEAQQEGRQTALATVVQVQGSSYRRPGARMLVRDDGQLTGAISGGCLEGDALRKARLAMLQQKSMLVTYDTTDEDDATLGVGLGCNGIIQILIEPIDPKDPANPISFFQSFLSSRQSAVVVTLFSLQKTKSQQPGTCLFIAEKGDMAGVCPDADLQENLLADAQQVLHSGVSLTNSYTSAAGELTGFVELLQPAVSLVIVGAGNDAVPLMHMANLLGWQVTVVDGRANYATGTRFPKAERVIVAKPEGVLSQLTIDSQTVFVLMTHNYNYDMAMLRQLLPLQVPYIGSLGPKKKLERMLEKLQDEGMRLSEEMLQRVYGPTGLDMGAETSEEIALSILAEMKAVLAGKPGTPLREKQGAIHERGKESPELGRQAKFLGCSL